jgi:hypothetical protein
MPITDQDNDALMRALYDAEMALLQVAKEKAGNKIGLYAAEAYAWLTAPAEGHGGAPG